MKKTNVAIWQHLFFSWVKLSIVSVYIITTKLEIVETNHPIVRCKPGA